MCPIIVADRMFGKNIIPKLHLCIKTEIQQVLGKVWKSVFLTSMAKRGLLYAPGAPVFMAATQGMRLDCLALGARGDCNWRDSS